MRSRRLDFLDAGDTGAEITSALHARAGRCVAVVGFLTSWNGAFSKSYWPQRLARSCDRRAVRVDPLELITSVQRGDVALTGSSVARRRRSDRPRSRDRLAQLPGGAPADAAPSNGADRVRGDLLSALQNLGYHRPQAEKAIDATLQTMSNPTFEHALKAALRELMR